MRKLYNTLLMTLLLVVAGSCGQKQDKIFRGSSAVRTQQQIDALSTALAAHPNGWSVAYFYGAAQAEHGGTTLLWKFDAESSTAEAASIYTGVDKTYTSNYTVKANGGALLTFDTYNKAVHYFSDPIAPGETVGDNLGLEGDFEFIVQSVADDKIVLISSKYRTPVIMTPLADDADWTATLEEAQTDETNLLAPTYEFYVNGEQLVTASFADHFIDMQVPVAGSEDLNRIQVPIIATATGFEAMEPFSLTEDDENPSIQHFTFDAELDRFTCSDDGVDFYIQKVFPPINETLVSMDATYSFDLQIGSTITYGGMSEAVQTMLETAQANNYGGAELLNVVALGKNPFYPDNAGPQAFSFRSYDGSTNWGSAFSYTITPVEGTIDQITFGNFGASLNASYYMQFFNFFISPIAAASPYTVVTDSPLTHTQYTFTSVSNPDIWFTVYK